MESFTKEIVLTIVTTIVTVYIKNTMNGSRMNKKNMGHVTQLSLSPYTRLQDDLIITTSWSVLVSIVLFFVYKLSLIEYFENKEFGVSTVGPIIYTISVVVVLFTSPLLWDLVKYQDNPGKRAVWIQMKYLILGSLIAYVTNLVTLYWYVLQTYGLQDKEALDKSEMWLYVRFCILLFILAIICFSVASRQSKSKKYFIYLDKLDRSKDVKIVLKNKEVRTIDFTSSYVRVLYPTGTIKVIDDLQTRTYDPEEIDYIKAGKDIYTLDKWISQKEKKVRDKKNEQETIVNESEKMRANVKIEKQDEV